MAKEEKRKMGYAARTGEVWGSVALPKALIDNLRSHANMEGISVALYLRRLVEKSLGENR